MECWMDWFSNSKLINIFFLNIRLHFLPMKIIYHLNQELEKLQRSVLGTIVCIVLWVFFPKNLEGKLLNDIFILSRSYLKSHMVRAKSVNNHAENQASCDKIFFFFCLFRATPTARGHSQARGQIRAVTASLRHSHSSGESKPHLRPYSRAHGSAGSLTH